MFVSSSVECFLVRFTLICSILSYVNILSMLSDYATSFPVDCCLVIRAPSEVLNLPEGNPILFV